MRKIIITTFAAALFMTGCGKVPSQPSPSKHELHNVRKESSNETNKHDKKELVINNVVPFNHGFKLQGTAWEFQDERIEILVNGKPTFDFWDEDKNGLESEMTLPSSDQKFDITVHQGLKKQSSYLITVQVLKDKKVLSSIDQKVRTTNVISKPRGIKKLLYTVSGSEVSVDFTTHADATIRAVHYSIGNNLKDSYYETGESSTDKGFGSEQNMSFPFNYQDVKGKKISFYTTDFNNNKSAPSEIVIE